MNMKRDNGVCEKIEEILKSENLTFLSSDERQSIEEMYSLYKAATYKEWSDRDGFYQEMMSNMVNSTCFKAKEAAKAMSTDHPTLQQSYMRLFVLFINEMAKKEYFDLRNEASVKLAKELMPTIKKYGYLPLI